MIKMSQQIPAITAGAYSAGDAVGGLLTFNLTLNNSNIAKIISAAIFDKAKQSVAINLALFSETFTATADNAAFVVWDGDARNALGVIEFAAANYAAFNASSMVDLDNIYKAVYSTDSLGRIFGQLYLPSGSAPTYASTADLIITLWAEFGQ